MKFSDVYRKMIGYLRQAWQWIKTFSFYETNATNEADRESGRIATRICIALIITFLVVFVLYSGLDHVTQTIVVPVTTINTYHRLAEKYTNLICPCTNIDLVQGDFIQLSPNYHPICSSDFLKEDWIVFLRSLANGYSAIWSAWNHMSLAQFELLNALCDLAENTVNDALSIFHQTKLLVSQINKQPNFLLQTQMISSTFYTSTQNSFARSLNLVNVLKQGDQFVSGLGTNYQFLGYLDSQWNYVNIYGMAVDFVDVNGVYCNCNMKSTCVRSVYVMNEFNNRSILIPGWVTGCYVQDALFHSTLECYFDTSCLTAIRHAYSAPLTVQVMLMRDSSQFTPQTTVGTIARKLFVDGWSESFNFTAYYQACAPKTCSYIVDGRQAFIVVLGTLVGIWGGLTKALDLLIPRLVKFVRRYSRRWGQNSVGPSQPVSSP